MTKEAPWFYCPDLAQGGSQCLLPPEEAAHALGSLRLGPGEGLTLFDGRGRVARARVAEADRRRRHLACRAEAGQRQAPPPRRMLAAALPKGDRQAVMLDMATQLGMTVFQPLVCERSVVRPQAGAARRWRRICLEACKQSRRAWLPEIRAPLSLAEALARAQDWDKWLAHPGGGVPPAGGPGGGAVMLCIGPEGGFTDAEVEAARRAGARPLSLGGAVLRVETAAVAALVCAAGWPAEGGEARGV